MKDGKFKSLVKDSYKKYKEGNIVGILYGAASNYGFSDIKDMDGFADASNPDMLYLKSKLTDTTVDVYSWDLEDYKIKESKSTIYIKIKNKGEIPIMY